MNVADGLANGARGTVNDIKFAVDPKTGKKVVKVVLFKFNDPRVGAEAIANSPYTIQLTAYLPSG